MGVSVLSKSPPTGRSAAANRARILDATVELLERGAAFAELNVGSISAQAGVSRPTFYAYFTDKRALILALGDRFEQRTHGVADAWLLLRDDDLESTLTGVLEAFRADHATLRAIVEAATYDDEVAVFWRAFHRRYIDAVVERAAQLQTGRDAESVHADAFALIWMTQRAVAEHLDAPEVSDAALVASLLRLWRAILPPVTADA
jgi:TetR/AcrR family transcriptional regulator, ethionamide resistance regulator